MGIVKNVTNNVNILILILFNISYPQSQDVISVQNSGPSENRIDLVFLPDGWTQNQSSQMVNEMNDHIETFFNVPTYARYKKFFNIYIVNHFRAPPPGGLTAEYSQQNKTYYRTKATEAVPTAEVRYVVTNGDGWGASSNGNMSITSNSDDDIIGVHELGHGWNSLGDIYDNAGGNGWPNSTGSPSSTKWEHWMGYVDPHNGDVIGIFPIESSQFYRPIENVYTLMGHARNRNRVIDFTAVGREKVVHDIYELVNPLDHWTPNNLTLKNPVDITVSVVDSDVIKVDWYLNGELIIENGSESFGIFNHISSTGQYTVKANAYDGVIPYAYSDRGGNPNGNPGSQPSDSLDWVRDDFDDITQEIIWNVSITEILEIGEKQQGSKFFKVQDITLEYLDFFIPKPGKYSVDLYTVNGKWLEKVYSGYSPTRNIRLKWISLHHKNKLRFFRIVQDDQFFWVKWAGF